MECVFADFILNGSLGLYRLVWVPPVFGALLAFPWLLRRKKIILYTKQGLSYSD